MNGLASLLPSWLQPGDGRPPAQIEDEVREELQLHLDLMTEELRQSGLDDEAARAQAQERFGDVDLLVRQCRTIQQGDIPMLQRVQTVLFVCLLAGLIALGWRVAAMDSALTSMSSLLADAQAQLEDLEKIKAELNAATDNTDPSLSELTPNAFQEMPVRLQGATTDRSSAKLPKVFCHTTVKTWGPGGYSQHPLQIRSDDLGEIPANTYAYRGNAYAVHSTAIKPGYAFVSQYHEKRDASEPCPALSFELPKSTVVRVTLKDARGEPFSWAKVVPGSRETPNGETHLVYHQGVLNAFGFVAESDEQGFAELNWFEEGDRAMIRVLPDGGAWTEAEFDVKATDKPIELTFSVNAEETS